MKDISNYTMLKIGIWRYQEKTELSALVQQINLKGSKLKHEGALRFSNWPAYLTSGNNE